MVVTSDLGLSFQLRSVTGAGLSIKINDFDILVSPTPGTQEIRMYKHYLCFTITSDA